MPTDEEIAKKYGGSADPDEEIAKKYGGVIEEDSGNNNQISVNPETNPNRDFSFSRMMHNTPKSAMNFVRGAFPPTAIYDAVKPGIQESLNQIKNPNAPKVKPMDRLGEIGTGLIKPFAHPLNSLEEDPIGTAALYASIGEGFRGGVKKLISSPEGMKMAKGVVKVASAPIATHIHPYLGYSLGMGGLKDLGSGIMEHFKPKVPELEPYLPAKAQLSMGQNTIPKVPNIKDLPLSENPKLAENHPPMETQKPSVITKKPIIQDLPFPNRERPIDFQPESTPSPREVQTRQVKPFGPRSPEVADRDLIPSSEAYEHPSGNLAVKPTIELPKAQDMEINPKSRIRRIMPKGEVIKPGSRNSKYDISVTD